MDENNSKALFVEETTEVSSQSSCIESVEESLETESMTESIDIRISPSTSTMELISFSSPSEFSYVADVEVQLNGGRQSSDFLTGDPLEAKVYEVRSKNPLKFPDKVTATPKQPESTLKGKRASSGVESKIAQEIQEMKIREEEIKQMREEREKMPKPTAPLPNTPPPHLPNTPPVKVAKVSSPVIMAGFQKASVFGRRKEVMSHKPSPSKPPETPIEREIRIAREREEELQRERALRLQKLPNGKHSPPPSSELPRTAASIIQRELQEMKEREQELKQSRDKVVLPPELLEGDPVHNVAPMSAGRRKSALIEEWERKIQDEQQLHL